MKTSPFVGLLILAGCEAGNPGPPVQFDASAGPDAGRQTFRVCTGRAFTPAPDEEWRHTTVTPLTLEAGAANHSAQDVLVRPGRTIRLPGKFVYGDISKDLEDEDVRVSLDDCAGWRDLGDHATSSDGRIFVDVPGEFGPGVYEVRYQVLGDGSQTMSWVWVLPSSTRIIVSDIDATLTTSDSEVFQQIYDGTYVPMAYPGAIDLTDVHAEKGWIVLYLTGRPYWLAQKTREWLVDQGTAFGPLHLTDSNEEAVPNEDGVGAYKLAFLESLVAEGWQLELAYGNATTDIYAYLGAGIPATSVWIIGDSGGMMGTHAVVDTWQPRADEVRAMPAITQPFDY